MQFSKMHGTGNDFIIISLLTDEGIQSFSKRFEDTPRSQVAQSLCDRHFGIGGDGLVLVESADEAGCDFKWDFYNSDGSSAEMCGNAARCIALWAHQNKISTGSVSFQSTAGIITAQVSEPNQVTIEMTPIQQQKLAQKVNVIGKNIEYDFINTGVPHAVLKIDNMVSLDSYNGLAFSIQRNPEFAPEKTNVTLYQVLKEGYLKSASFERGVEDFTLACGTGAVAAAYAYKGSGFKGSQVQLELPGGSVVVDVTSDVPKLTGPAEFVFLGKI